MVENLPANAGDTGSSPGLGRSHMLRSNWVHEPQLLSLRVWSLCSATREAAIVRGPCTAMKSGPRLPQLQKALAEKRRPNTAINKINKKKKKKKCLGLIFALERSLWLLCEGPTVERQNKRQRWEFPGGPVVVRSLFFHRRGPRFDPSSGN